MAKLALNQKIESSLIPKMVNTSLYQSELKLIPKQEKNADDDKGETIMPAWEREWNLMHLEEENRKALIERRFIEEKQHFESEIDKILPGSSHISEIYFKANGDTPRNREQFTLLLRELKQILIDDLPTSTSERGQQISGKLTALGLNLHDPEGQKLSCQWMYYLGENKHISPVSSPAIGQCDWYQSGYQLLQPQSPQDQFKAEEENRRRSPGLCTCYFTNRRKTKRKRENTRPGTKRHPIFHRMERESCYSKSILNKSCKLSRTVNWSALIKRRC